MTIILRPATADDLMRVGALHHRSRMVTYRDIVPAEALRATSAEQLGRWWVERWPYERQTHLMTVAELSGRLVGFSYVGPHQPDDDPDHPDGVADDDGAAGDGAGCQGAAADGRPALGELSAIHVHPDRQGQGIGRELMCDALTTLHQRGWRRAVLWVLAGNTRARAFYAKGGWAPDGVQRDDAIGAAVTRQLRYARDLP